jgi:hypothetical protein
MLGQASKVLTLRFPGWQRALLLIPALALSPLTFLLALWRFPEFAASRRAILAQRPHGTFYLLRTILEKRLG